MTSPRRSSLRHRPGRERPIQERESLGLQLLGGFELRCGQRRIPVPLHVQRVLAFLALHERPLRRAFVCGRLWTDSTQERAFGSLRTTLWRIHRVGVPVVEVTSTHLALAPSVVVDVRGLEATAHRAIAPRSKLVSNDVYLLAEAHELLPDWYEDWVVEERDHLTEMCVQALESACEALVAARNFKDATVAAHAAVAADPLRESARLLAIRAHLEAGNDVEAVRQYIDYRDRIRSELGLAPSLRMLRLIHSPVHTVG